MTKNVKALKEFDLIKSQHIIAIGILAAVFASILIIQDQKETINQTINNEAIEAKAQNLARWSTF